MTAVNLAWSNLRDDIVACDACPRLRTYCTEVARTKRAAYRDWDYWGKPVPPWGDPHGRILILGLAPAAHGANRTGRGFTGDRSGDFLFRALHDAGLATHPFSREREDGCKLRDAVLANLVNCAPPSNRADAEEVRRCRAYLDRLMRFMPNLRVVVALGKVAFDGCVRLLRDMGRDPGSPMPKFGHGVRHELEDGLTLHGAYHPSQQNTFTGRLTPAMLLEVFQRALQDAKNQGFQVA